MILLKSLALKNFLSHEDTKIEFKPDERLLISGISGSGKSAIVDGVIFALFARGRVQNRSLIRRGEKAAQVTLELMTSHLNDPENCLYKLIRKIDTKGVHSIEILTVGGPIFEYTPLKISGTKNIQEFIEKELIKCSYTLFVNSCFYPQENMDSFVRQTPAKRKDLLMELLKTAQYGEWYEKCRNALSELNQKLFALGERTSYLVKDILAQELMANNYEVLNAQVKESEEILDSLGIEINEIKDSQRITRELSQRIEQSLTEIKRLDSELYKNLEKKDHTFSELSELKSLDIEYLKTQKNRFEELELERNSLVSSFRKYTEWQNEMMVLGARQPQAMQYDETIRGITEQIKKLEDFEIKEELCTNCGKLHKCSLIGDDIKSRTKEWVEKLVFASEQKQAAMHDIKLFEEKVREMETKKPQTDSGRLMEVEKEAETLKESVARYNLAMGKEQLVEKLESIIKECEENQMNLLSLQITQKEEISRLEEELSVIQLKFPSERISALLRQQGEVKGSYAEALQQLTLAGAAKKRVKEILKDQVENKEKKLEIEKELKDLELLKEAFGTNGIKAMVIDYSLPVLEDRINEVLSKLSDFRVHMNTQKSSVDGDKEIEGLYINVINETGEEVEYSAYSGGEKIKITFAIAEGLASMQKLRFRILDEAVVSLDSETGQEFAETIISLEAHYSQLIAISHVQAIKDLFADKLEITKTNGISHIAS